MFKKYSSIENSYRDAHINRIRMEHPSVDQMTWVLTEKLHGCNISFEGRPKSKLIKVARRKDYLATGEKFNGLWNYLEQINFDRTWAPVIKTYANATGEVVRFYAEYLAGQKGVQYSEDITKIRFFDVMVGDEYIDQKNFFETMVQLNMPTVPIIAMRQGLTDALSFDVDTLKTTLGPDKMDMANWAEGVVGKPWNKVLRLNSGSLVCFKKKHPKFQEKDQGPKVKKPLDSFVEKMRAEFRLYFNENRMQSVFSKEGPIKHRKQIGKYIKWMMTDAQADFIKDNEEELANVSKSQMKQILNLGGEPAHLLQRFLNESK